ncbi:MAG: hypothetical protein QXK47_02430 [Candidatus Bathyarchaeia archaeon]
MSNELENQILKIIRYQCLNTHEICRALNGLPIEDPTVCGLPVKLKPFRKGTKEVLGKSVNCQGELYGTCKFKYKKVRATLHSMKQLNSKLMRWWDKTRLKGAGRRSDLFRFWWIKYEDFHKRVLTQTLIPYVYSKAKSSQEVKK